MCIRDSPQEAQVRADVNRWMFWACQHYSPAIGVLTWENIWKGMTGNGEADPQEVARGTDEVHTYGTVLDTHLAERQWLVGDTLTLADIAVAAPMMYIDRAKVPLRGFPNIMRWFAQIEQLDAWKQTQVQI